MVLIGFRTPVPSSAENIQILSYAVFYFMSSISLNVKSSRFPCVKPDIRAASPEYKYPYCRARCNTVLYTNNVDDGASLFMELIQG